METVAETPASQREFGEFIIDAFTPDTIPMARLAEYMTRLVDLLGAPADLHFDRIEAGSASVRYWTRKEAIGRVAERPRSLASGTADAPTRKAFLELNKLLEADGAIGELKYDGVVVPFPGRERVRDLEYTGVEQELSVEGQLVRIGGKGRQIKATLQDGTNFTKFDITRDLAKEMCHLLFGPNIRVRGKARFDRDSDGVWILQSFRVTRFDELDDAPLSDVVRRWRAIEGNGWTAITDPLQALAQISTADEF